MADFVFNIALGKVAYYSSLPGANDALIAVPIETAGIETDAVLRDYDNLSVILAAANNEQTTMGRKTLATVTNTVDDTNNWLDTDAVDPVWSAPTGNAISKIIVCYDPDTTGGSDTDLIPLTAHDFVVTPNGLDITAVIATGGFYRATSAA
jgi:hypothetical protein